MDTLEWDLAGGIGSPNATSVSQVRALAPRAEEASDSVRALCLDSERPSMKALLRRRFVRAHCAFLERLARLWSLLEETPHPERERSAAYRLFVDLTEFGEALAVLGRFVSSTAMRQEDLGGDLEVTLTQAYDWLDIVASDLEDTVEPTDWDRVFLDARLELSILFLKQRLLPAAHRSRRTHEGTVSAWIERLESVACSVHDALVAIRAAS